jgi:diguanylate cyclase (GGDEF)-like protein
MTLDKNILYEKITKIQDDLPRIDLMIDESEACRKEDPNLAQDLGKEAIKLAREKKYRKGIARGLMNLGTILYEKSRYLESVPFFREAVDLNRKLPDEQHDLLAALNRLGATLSYIGEYAESINILKEALHLSEKLGDISYRAKVYANLGSIHADIGHLEDGLDHFLKALDIFRTQKDSHEEITISLNNIGNVYKELGEFDKALAPLTEGYTLARTYNLTALISSITTEIGEVLQKQGEPDKAEDYFQRALELAREQDFTDCIADSLLKLADLRQQAGEYGDSATLAEEALEITKKNSLLYMELEAHKLLTKIQENQHQYHKALNHAQDSIRLEKRLHDAKMGKSIRTIESDMVKKSNQRIKIISEIGQEITSTLRLEEVLETVYRRVNELMDASLFGIGRYLPETDQMVYEMRIFDGKRLSPLSRKIGNEESFFAVCVKEGRTVHLNRVQDEYLRYISKPAPHFPDVRMGGNQQIQSLIYVPLKVKNLVTGCISVQSYKENAYSTYDLDSLQALAGYVSIALNNAIQSEIISKQNIELKQLSIVDELTGIFNRREMNRQLETIWNWSRRLKSPISLLMIDADHFKKVNDHYGHQAGDEVLHQLAQVISNKINRSSDFCARYGGEEFIVVLPDTPLESAMKIAEAIRLEVEQTIFTFKGGSHSIKVSIGVAAAGSEKILSLCADTLISMADEALYQAKHAGRNCVRVSGP